MKNNKKAGTIQQKRTFKDNKNNKNNKDNKDNKDNQKIKVKDVKSKDDI